MSNDRTSDPRSAAPQSWCLLPSGLPADMISDHLATDQAIAELVARVPFQPVVAVVPAVASSPPPAPPPIASSSPTVAPGPAFGRAGWQVWAYAVVCYLAVCAVVVGLLTGVGIARHASTVLAIIGVLLLVALWTVRRGWARRARRGATPP